MELLERASFLQTLAEYAGEARQGDGRLVLVSGESGMGKTVLLETFQASLPGARWLWGACDGLLTPRPLGPLFDIGPQAGGQLAQLCSGEASRGQLFGAFLAELDSPVAVTVVVIEDAHWADEATLDLLSFLGRRLSRKTALLLVTYRDDELGDHHPLRMVLGDLATQRSTRRMVLPPLSSAAVRALVGQRDLDAAELYRVTGGNPFYVCEMVEAGWPAIPPTVRDVVGARLARSSPVARESVQVAAVIGARVGRPLLMSVLAGPDSLIDECLATGVLVADGADLAFRHELFRMTVADTIVPHRKIELHARLLAVLEQARDADPAVLAHHAEGAGDAGAVRRHAPAAARRSSALGAHREAAAQYERALRFAAADDRPALAGLHEALASEYSLLDRWPEAEHELRTALTLRRELGDDRAVGEDLRMLSTALWRLCRGDESEWATEEAVRVLEALPPGPELAWAYSGPGICRVDTGRVDEGFDIIERGRALGERLRDPEVVSYALNLTGFALVESGRDGTGPIRQALEIALDADLQEAVGRAYSCLQEACARLHRFGDADRCYAEGMTYCEDRELGVFSMCLLGWRAESLMLLGRWDEAAEISTQMLNRPGISPVNQLNPLRVLGTIRCRRGDPGAWELLDQVLALGERTSEPARIAQARAVRAELCWVTGRPQLAAAEAVAGYDHAIRQRDPWRLGSVAIWLSRLRAGVDLPAGLPEPYAREMAGDWPGAAAAWQRLGRPYDAALAWLGSANEAGLRQALGALDGLGARAAAAAARRRMKQLGITAIPRGPRAATRARPAGLTPREQEVLALLAEGLPDREISRRLVISERTVHHHVSAVLSKIGVSSRTAAAREAARMGLEIPA